MYSATTTPKIVCACRNCPNDATIYLKISFVNKTGIFCKSCAVDLKDQGIAEEVVQEDG